MTPMGYRETRWGKMIYLPQDRYVGRSITEYGEYSRGETRLFEQLVKPGMTVVEVGAHFGSHTLCFARLVGEGGLVMAFEPQPMLAQLVAANSTINRLGWVMISEAAAGERRGVATIPRIDYSQPGNFGAVEVGVGEIEVPVLGLDELDLVECDFMKVDVEGMETEVLRGAEKYLTTHPPLIYLEDDRPEKHRGLVETLEGWGYRCYWHVVPLFEEDNFSHNPTNVFGEVCSFNLLAAPAGVEVQGLERSEAGCPPRIVHE